LNAAANPERLGFAAQGVGDVNGDGIVDFVVGAPSFGSNFSGNGAVFVVFGSAAGFPAALLDSDLDGTNGFRLDGTGGEGAGHSVAAAGDVNGDGLGDILVGANGAAYVVFGKKTAFDATMSLGALTGANGFKIAPTVAGAFGFSVSSAGD